MTPQLPQGSDMISLRGNFDENLLKLTVQKILELQNYGCWCPKLVKEKKSDALCGETVDVIDGYCHDWARCKKCTTLHPYYSKIQNVRMLEPRKTSRF